MPSPSDFEAEVVLRVVRQVLAQGEDTADRDRLCPRRALEMCLPHLERLAGLPTAAAVDLRTSDSFVVRDELVQLGLARPAADAIRDRLIRATHADADLEALRDRVQWLTSQLPETLHWRPVPAMPRRAMCAKAGADSDG